MTKATPRQIKQLAGLSALTNMALEARLADLRRSAEARDATRAALEALARPITKAEGEVSMIAQARVDLNYERWVDHKRAEMNLLLARQTAAWLIEREGAARAFGRNEVLGELTTKLRKDLLQQSKRK